MTISNIQLGKQGVTENFISTLESHFKKHDNVKIHVLKSAGHDKQKIKTMADEMLEKLGKKYTAKVIGFVIVIKKWRRAVSRK